jgi:predicted dehydrogenase
MAATPLRFALLGTGFWSRFQLAAWEELQGAICVALFDPVPGRAAAAAARLRVPPPAFTDVASLLDSLPRLDFVDIVSPVETHPALVEAAAARGIPIICQKPMAPTLAQATRVGDPPPPLTS